MKPLLTLSLRTPVILTGCALAGGVFGVRSGYEAPPHEILESFGEKIEIRQYAERLVAEVEVSAQDGREDENGAFRLLFDYITGSNSTAEKVAMTVPVETVSESEKIAMTVPVEVAGTQTGTMTMRFFFPAKYTLETAPRPSDERVRLNVLPPATFAVRSIKGSAGERSRTRAAEELSETLKDSPWTISGPVSTWYYDPPFAIPVFRLTEVVAPVAQRQTAEEDPSPQSD